MKKILFIVGFTLLPCFIFAQVTLLTKKISIHEENITFKSLLEKLNHQYQLNFSYSDQLIQLDKNITLNFTEAPLSKVLDEALKGTSMQYHVIGDQIVLSKIKTKAAAKTYTINGYIREEENNEAMIGTHIYASKLQIGTTSNNYGFYSITLPADSIALTYSYLGYTTQQKTFYLQKDTTIQINLISNIELAGVEVVGKSNKDTLIDKVSTHNMMDLPLAQMTNLPALSMGEKDVFKVMQLLPGVQGGLEATNGLYVRGASPDQNLVLLDGAPLYYTSHLLGFLSVINESAIRNVDFYKSAFPARFSGKLSSVLDIQTKEGNMKKWQGEFFMSPIAPKFTIEGPIIKNKTSFMLAARRPLYDALINLLTNKNNQKYSIGFYDINTKITHQFSDKNRLSFSFYKGADFFKINYNNSTKGIEKVGWDNWATTLRWSKTISSKIFLHSSVLYTRYRFLTYSKDINYYNELSTGIQDITTKVDFDYIPSPRHYIKFGTNLIHHAINTDLTLQAYANSKINAALENNIYIEDDIKLFQNLKVNVGLNLANFLRKKDLYTSLQPRIALLYLKHNWALKASYSKMTQFIYLVTNQSLGLPIDIWSAISEKQPPQISNQFSLGASKYFGNNKYEISVEGYYKTFKNLIDFKDFYNFTNLSLSHNKNDIFQNNNNLQVGSGLTYGAEFFLHKKQGRWNSWLGYTLAWNNRTFANINQGKTFPYVYDRRHVVDLTFNYNISSRLSFGANWNYSTGYRYTPPIAQYKGLNDFSYTLNAIQYGDKNSGILSPYHRLDIGFQLKKKKSRGERTWALGVYNVYNRHNASYLVINRENGNFKLNQITLIPFLPYISYQFKF